MKSKLLIIGEAHGSNEAKIGRGFVGATGSELFKLLDEAGVIKLTSEDYSYISKYWQTEDPTHLDMVWNMHPELYRTNVFNLHPPSNKIEAFCGTKAGGIAGYPALVKGKYVRSEFLPELDRLGSEIIDVNPNLILALGNTAMWAILGRTTISKLRGTTSYSTHTVSDYKVLPTYHPAAIFRQWELRPTLVIDLMKAAREQEFPEIRRPKREVWIEPTLEDIDEFDRRYIQNAERLAVDIETSGSVITCIGFAPSRSLAIVIPFTDERKLGKSYWPTHAHEHSAWKAVRTILERPKPDKVLQNGIYDLAFLWRAYGIRVYGFTEDCMLAHHALQPESLKSLGYLASLYCDLPAWKASHTAATIKRDA